MRWTRKYSLRGIPLCHTTFKMTAGFPLWGPILCGGVVQPLITTAIMKFFLDCWLPGWTRLASNHRNVGYRQLVHYVKAKRRIDELKISRRKRWHETRLSTFLSRTGYLAGRLAVSSSQETRSFLFCWLSRKERAKSRRNEFSYIGALRFLLLLVPRKERAADRERAYI